jgi:septal ring factor EnvC (AmiA/AmiB activator)
MTGPRWCLGALLIALSLSACADSELTALDEDLRIYRYEQEKYRGEDLERLYREEAARSESLAAEITALREQISAQERELEALRRRSAELGAPPR